jgi:hypothetical protein
MKAALNKNPGQQNLTYQHITKKIDVGRRRHVQLDAVSQREIELIRTHGKEN